MIDRIRRSALLALPLVVLAGLLACDAGAQDPATGGAAATSADTREAPATAADETYVVTIGSGPFAGTYRGADELNCIIDDETWSADFDAERDRGVSALMVHLEGVSETGGTTVDGNIMVIFGRVADGAEGSGGVGAGGGAGGSLRATAERDGADAVMRLEGTTSYGARVAATVRCRSVD